MSIVSSLGQSSNNLILLMLESRLKSSTKTPCLSLSVAVRRGARRLGNPGAPPWRVAPVPNSPPMSPSWCKGRSSKRKLRSSQLSLAFCVGVMMIVICEECCGYEDGDVINAQGDASDACV